MEWHLDAAPEDPRVTLLRNGTLRLHPLPVLLFPSGHVAFVQRLPWRWVGMRCRRRRRCWHPLCCILSGQALLLLLMRLLLLLPPLPLLACL